MIKDFIRKHLGGNESLRRQAIFSGNWLFTKSVLLGGLDLIKTAMFARVLSATDYGVMALAVMTTGFLESFTTLALGPIIVRDGDDIEKRLRFYWGMKIVRGIILFFLAWYTAVPISIYYKNASLVWIIRFISISFLLDGLAGFGREMCFRKMDFKKISIYEIAASSIVLITGIFFLLFLRNIWALALYAVINSFFQFCISYIIYPWRIRIGFSKTILKYVISFGGAVIVINILNYAFSNIDRATVGKLIGIEQLGFYARGNFLALIPATYIASTLAPIFLPAFKKIADDPTRLRKAFLKVLGIYILLFGFASFILFVFSRTFVLIIYGEKWLPVLPVFRILLIFGIFKGVVTICPPVFFLKGRPWFGTLSTFISVAIFGLLCIPMTKAYQTTGTAWAVVIGGIIGHVIAIIFAYKLLLSPPTGSAESNEQKIISDAPSGFAKDYSEESN